MAAAPQDLDPGARGWQESRGPNALPGRRTLLESRTLNGVATSGRGVSEPSITAARSIEADADALDPGSSICAGCAVLVFAKAPVAGYAKTRLAPCLGEAGAAALADRLLAHAVHHAVEAGLGPVELWCAPDCGHPAFEKLHRRHGVALHTQRGADLGERMAHAVASALQQHAAALVIGTDAPALDARYLQQAARRLQRCDVVIGPAADGGYVLVGMKHSLRGLFEDILWSTPDVLAKTRLRIARLGLTHHELPTLADIDEPADLCHLPPEWRISGDPDSPSSPSHADVVRPPDFIRT